MNDHNLRSDDGEQNTTPETPPSGMPVDWYGQSKRKNGMPGNGTTRVFIIAAAVLLTAFVLVVTSALLIHLSSAQLIPVLILTSTTSPSTPVAALSTTTPSVTATSANTLSVTPSATPSLTATFSQTPTPIPPTSTITPTSTPSGLFGIGGAGIPVSPTPNFTPYLTTTPSTLPMTTPSPVRSDCITFTADPTQAKIAYETNRDGGWNIYVTDRSGQLACRLTQAGSLVANHAYQPAWSPDNRQLVFVSDRGNTYQLYTMNADGSNPHQLTNDNVAHYHPRWSADGQHIAFVEQIDKTTLELHEIDADGSNARLLVNDNHASSPVWSPDGTKLAFDSVHNGADVIEIANPDGSDPTHLFDNGPNTGFSHISWSADSRSLIFDSQRSGNPQVYTANADGTGLHQLTTSKEWSYNSCWLDGEHIVFASTRDGHAVIYLMNADGSEQHPITQDTAKISDDNPACTTASAAAIASTPAVFSTITKNAQWTPHIQNFGGVDMVLVPSGCFMMGDDNSHASGNDFLGEKPASKQCFGQPFWIDKDLVTNGQFVKFKGKASNATGSEGNNGPRNIITWFESRDFCLLRGAQLPTEVEWEYAARGPDDLAYPWGNDFVANNAVYGNEPNNSLADIESKPHGVSWVGAYDMAGDVLEWTSTLYKSYPYNAADGRENNSDVYNWRVLRGGSWLDSPEGLLSAKRANSIPGSGADYIGFRCARSSTTSGLNSTIVSPTPSAVAIVLTPSRVPTVTTKTQSTPQAVAFKDGAMVSVQLGCFMMGSDLIEDSQAQRNEQPAHPVCINHDFKIDQYDVTNAAFATFVKAGGYTTDSYWSPDPNALVWKQANKITGPETDSACLQYSSEAKQPRVCVSYYEAEAYANWRTQTAKDGLIYRLPTEAEWEYAARGPKSWIYPWGNTWNPANANTVESGLGKASPVDSYPNGVSLVGAYGMVGNISQWVADCYSESFYKNRPGTDIDPINLCSDSSTLRGLRGGAFLLNQFLARAAYRYGSPPSARTFDVGFRLVAVSPNQNLTH